MRPCSGWGLPSSRYYYRDGELLPRHFTLIPIRPDKSGLFGTVYFLWHYPSGCPAPPLTGILPSGARTFLPPRQTGTAVARPPRARPIVSRGCGACQPGPPCSGMGWGGLPCLGYGRSPAAWWMKISRFVTHPPAHIVFSWGFPPDPCEGGQPPFETPDRDPFSLEGTPPADDPRRPPLRCRL